MADVIESIGGDQQQQDHHAHPHWQVCNSSADLRAINGCGDNSWSNHAMIINEADMGSCGCCDASLPLPPPPPPRQRKSCHCDVLDKDEELVVQNRAVS